MHKFKLLAVSTLLFWAGQSGAYVEGGMASAMELALMPRYCWSDYKPELKKSPGFFINCGVGTNHYCGGLLILMRAEKMAHGSGRLMDLNRSKHEIDYTMRYMDNPDNKNCFIRKEAEKILAKLNTLIRQEESLQALKKNRSLP